MEAGIQILTGSFLALALTTCGSLPKVSWQCNCQLQGEIRLCSLTTDRGVEPFSKHFFQGFDFLRNLFNSDWCHRWGYEACQTARVIESDLKLAFGAIHRVAVGEEVRRRCLPKLCELRQQSFRGRDCCVVAQPKQLDHHCNRTNLSTYQQFTMASSGSGYDLSASTFSPDGRIFQVEYATKAVENAGTVLAIKGSNGVVLGVAKPMHHKMIVASS